MKKEDFIKRARQFHGNKYDYSLVPKKVTSRQNISIICPYHGEFEQIKYNHEKGSKCPFCTKEILRKKLLKTTDQFIKDAKKVHRDKYDYSKVEYKTSHDKIFIICSYHGEFQMKPYLHLNGKGCPKCKRDEIGKRQTLTTEQFIEMARKVHGDKYDYSKTEYMKDNTEVIITCPIHGDFIQTANAHKHGQGCLECGKISKDQKNTKGREKFIEEARKVHNGKYDYSKVPKDMKVKNEVTIICPTHGEFKQIAYHHLEGYGCRTCRMSHGEKKIKDFLDNNNISYENEKRFESLGLSRAFDFYIPNYNLIIEFDGVQHFQSIKFSGNMSEEDAKQNFHSLQERDKFKNN